MFVEKPLYNMVGHPSPGCRDTPVMAWGGGTPVLSRGVGDTPVLAWGTLLSCRGEEEGDICPRQDPEQDFGQDH